MRKILIVLFIIFISTQVQAATYYVDASAANDSGNGSIGSPKKYIPSGIALLSTSGGDTLIIKNGTYAGSSNNITSIPNSATNYNIVQAETDGGVIITASLAIASGQHCDFVGLKFQIAETKSIASTYTRFFRCSFQGGEVCSSNCNGAVNIATGSYQLYEDCWFYGVGGRYTVMIYEEHNTVFRRCVIRHDAGYTADEGNPESPFVIYASYNVALLNCIIIDNTLTYSGDYTTDLYVTGHPAQPSIDGCVIQGCIFINGKNGSFYYDNDSGSTGMSFVDNVFYNNDSGINMSNGGSALSINRLTIGDISGASVDTSAGSVTVINGNFFNHGGANDGSATYTNTYNPSSYSGTGITHIDPVSNGLLYLPRIEDGSTLKTAGSSGGQMGAQVIKKVGTSGTLYGESGYNTVTNDNLWPWPNEDRIKADMEAVSDRGFTAYSGMDGVHNTLTTYIWEYLGNEIPADIYGGEEPSCDADHLELCTTEEICTGASLNWCDDACQVEECEEPPAATTPLSGFRCSGCRINL